MKRKIVSIALMIAVIFIGLFFINGFINPGEAQKENQFQENTSSIIPVEIAEAKKRSVQKKLLFRSVLEPKRNVTLISEGSGKVLFAAVSLGDKVAKGQVLVKLESEVQEAQLNAAEARLLKAKKDVTRLQDLKRENNVSETDLENAELELSLRESEFKELRKQFENTRLTSPFTGYVVEKSVELGMNLQIGTPVYKISDLSELKLIVYVHESDIENIHKGLAVQVKINNKNETFKGVVKQIGVLADNSRKFPVEIVLQNTQSIHLLAGVSATITMPSIQNEALTIPRIAVLKEGEANFVYLYQNGKTVKTMVEISETRETDVIIHNGLNENEQVVVKGQNLIEKERLTGRDLSQITLKIYQN
ncbi:MAG: efflux RND transporter periplasmic adaptor subunit [Chloroherpetonaceae bacterium]|nr:efflux RND transporter periplasmic adaptor subunit [Chloroherpetonaceae bacterium]